MDCLYRGPLPGGGYVIACGRRRRVKCATCKAADARLECDGCDEPLGAECAVSPVDELDFCPRCFEPAWRHWLRTLSAIPGHREQRRDAFRLWARAEPMTFAGLVRLSPTSLDLRASAMEKCPRCAGGLGAAPELCSGFPLHLNLEKKAGKGQR